MHHSSIEKKKKSMCVEVESLKVELDFDGLVHSERLCFL